MKLLKYTLIGIVVLLGLNLLTFYLFGKQSLRERNVKVILGDSNLKNEMERLAFPLQSNLELEDSITIRDKLYPVFAFDSHSSELLGEYAEITENPHYEVFDYSLVDSVEEHVMGNSGTDHCIFHEQEPKKIECYIFERTIIRLYEKIFSINPIYTNQEIGWHGYGDDYFEERDEILIWILFRWVLVKKDEEGGLGLIG